MLNKEEIKKLVNERKLIEHCIDLEIQLTPNGFDLTAGKIFQFTTPGALDFSNKERVVPECKELSAQKKDAHDAFGWWNLPKGAYKVRTNEVVNLPNDLIAVCYTRTSLLRVGAFTQHGIWDAGFSGKGEFILIVENTFGITLKENARVAQLVFFPTRETEAYQGIYKNLK